MREDHHKDLSASGWVRDDAVVIVLQGDSEKPFDLSIRLKGRGPWASLVRRWPDDFSASVEGRRALAIPLCDCPSPLVAVDLRRGDREIAVSSDWHIGALYPLDATAFEAMFYRSKRRINDRETQLFSVLQVMDHYRLDVAHESVAAVIAAYRLIDRGDLAGMTRWVDAVGDLFSRLDGAARTHVPRSDRDHQRGSMYTVLWLVLLALGRFDEAVDALEDYVATIRAFDAEVSPTVILNGCLGLVLRAQLFYVAGDFDRCAELHAFNHRFYVDNLWRLEPHAIWFKELAQAHDTVTFSLMARERLASGAKGLDAMTVFRTSHRVNTGSGKRLLEAQFSKLYKILKKRRQAPVAAGASEKT